MKQLPREVPTQPLPKGVPPKKTKGESWIVRAVFIGGAILVLSIIASYLE